MQHVFVQQILKNQSCCKFNNNSKCVAVVVRSTIKTIPATISLFLLLNSTQKLSFLKHKGLRKSVLDQVDTSYNIFINQSFLSFLLQEIPSLPYLLFKTFTQESRFPISLACHRLSRLQTFNLCSPSLSRRGKRTNNF